MNAVGAARLDEFRPVVEDEQRAVLLARLPEGLGHADECLVVEVLVAQLDDVDAAAQGWVQQRTRARVEDEVEAGARQALAAAGPVHRARLLAHRVLRLSSEGPGEDSACVAYSLSYSRRWRHSPPAVPVAAATAVRPTAQIPSRAVRNTGTRPPSRR
jgi:hypothetical protein